MNNNIINQVAFLRTAREFPHDLDKLTLQMNKSWVDIASAVNVRTIGLFPTVRPAITGEEWFLVNTGKQQTLRQVYTFKTTVSINHGISVTDINQFTRCWGSYTDNTNSFGLIWGTSSATTIPGQISFYLSPTQIIFIVDGAASAIQRGRIILEWLSSP